MFHLERRGFHLTTLSYNLCLFILFIFCYFPIVLSWRSNTIIDVSTVSPCVELAGMCTFGKIGNCLEFWSTRGCVFCFTLLICFDSVLGVCLSCIISAATTSIESRNCWEAWNFFHATSLLPYFSIIYLDRAAKIAKKVGKRHNGTHERFVLLKAVFSVNLGL